MVHINIIKNIIAAVAVAPAFLVLAAPTPGNISTRALPSNAARLAFDESNHQIIAFDKDGKNLGSFPFDAAKQAPARRDAGTCNPLSSDEVQKLPGWSTSNDKATANWGGGSRNIVTNDKDYPSYQAQVCVDSGGVNFQYDKDPTQSCHTTKNNAHGNLQNGTITLTNQDTQSTTGTTEVTRSTTVGADLKIKVGVTIPSVVEVSSELSLSIDVTNSLSQTTAVTDSHQITQTITQTVDDGETNCQVFVDTTTCSVTGSGSVLLVATGWVWFEFNKATDGHYKWALNIDSELPNQSDRSESWEMKYSGQVSSDGAFSAEGCKKEPKVTQQSGGDGQQSGGSGQQSSGNDQQSATDSR